VNAAVIAAGSNGAGIGSGYALAGTVFVANITIVNGNITATGSGAAVGVGDSDGNSMVAAINIGHGRTEITATPGGGACSIVADSIAIANAQLTVKAPSAPAFGSLPSAAESDLTVLYGNATSAISEPLARCPGSFLQIGELTLPLGRKWNIAIRSDSTVKTVEIDFSRVKSLLTSLEGAGAYRLTAASGVKNGSLVTVDGSDVFTVDSTAVFFPVARFVASPVNTVPVLTRTSPPSWGTFTASGPASDQVIQFTLADPDAGQSWTLNWRFDSEAWRTGGVSLVPGNNAYIFGKALFVGTRVRAGTHTASVYVIDSEGASSNVISVSYTIAASATALRSARFAFFTLPGIMLVWIITHFIRRSALRSQPLGLESL
jgi:hypothetical protein